MSQPQPPQWMVRLLRKILDPYLFDSVYGDLLEEYNTEVQASGLSRARRLFLIRAMGFLRHSCLRRRSTYHQSGPVFMLKHHLKLSTRHIRRNLLFSSISILGTAFSLVGIVLIGFYLTKEFSYDQFFETKEQVYRLVPVYHNENNDRPMPSAPPALAPLLTGRHAGIDKISRHYISDINNVLAYDNVSFVESRIFYADSTFLEILDFPMLAGNAAHALDEPNTVVLSKNHALKYFGKLDVVGETLRFNQERLLRVTGVIDPPETSHLDLDVLMSLSTFVIPYGYTDDFSSWRWNSFFTYIKLKEGVAPEQIEAFVGKVWLENQDRERKVSIRLQPLTDIYLGSEEVYHPYFASHYRTGDLSALYGLIGALLLILFIAGFNLMNLSSASLTRRGSNLEIARVLGSRPRSHFIQFFLESMLLSFTGLVLALVIVHAFSAQFSDMIGYHINLFSTEQGLFLVSLFTLTVFYTIIPLIPPMFKLYKSRKAQTYQGISIDSSARLSSSKSLVMIFQLIITTVLLTATLMVRQQLIYIAEKDLGFEQEQVLVAEMQGDVLEEKYELLQQVMGSNARVAGISRSKYALNGKSGGSPLKLATQDDSESFGAAVYESHYDFLEVMGIELLAGRSFSRDIKTDSARGIVLNKKAVELLGLDVSEAVGQNVQLLDWEKTVIGVVSDFHFASLHGEVRPLAMVLPFTHSTKVLIRMNPGNIAENVASIDKDWKVALPGIPFDFRFLDSSIEQLYARDKKFSKLISTFALIAIVVAMMGLYGVSGFLIQLRLKETAIRKVLGASYRQILLVLSRRFLIQLFIAVSVSIPVSLLIIKQWLQNFSYALNPNAALIAGAILAVVVLGALTILYQSSRVALLNPSKNLRSE